MKGRRQKLLLILILALQVGGTGYLYAQHSVAREWSEEMLFAIRHDLARPPIHARNLFHTSIAMYDAWAVYDQKARPFLLGVKGFGCPFTGIAPPANVQLAREEAISYAAFRVLKHRFKNSPGAALTLPRLANLMILHGYDTANHLTNYASGSPAALGNYLAQCIIQFGLTDGANETGNYAYQHYTPLNPPIDPVTPGNPTIVDPNRWQPISLVTFIDQSGNTIPGTIPKFLGPEWGNVVPFALTEEDKHTGTRSGQTYTWYHDEGPPPYYGQSTDAYYKWSMVHVAVWSSHLDPTDGVMWDISPASIGNVQSIPTNYADYDDFYRLLDGGDPGTGWDLNPVTGLPYVPQIVPRGDYVRVLAEFWADGPNSETPPGHWYSILNYVNDHPQLSRKFRGEGAALDPLEWDVKAYFTLGGAVHDAAISAWSLKGWYDYVRPLSGIRFLADVGQSSDPLQPNYNTGGITLIPGYIEVVQPGDPLAGPGDVNAGKIKLLSWRTHDVISDPATEAAGVGWILAENWWPYQRRTFITPPFSGFISGHSTFSRAAAEVLTLLTGTPFFPGGMGEFMAERNEFLVFEEGPSVDVKLQWATYRDASDQTSLSRIWGGIHVGADDLVGRIIGREVGINAFELAEKYFEGIVTGLEKTADKQAQLFPNPAHDEATLILPDNTGPLTVHLMDQRGIAMRSYFSSTSSPQGIKLDLSGLPAGFYILQATGMGTPVYRKLVVR